MSRKKLMTTVLALSLGIVFAFSGSVFAAHISFNRATVKAFMGLEDVDIPEEVAKAMVEYREKNGPYKSPEDLLKVPGMTEDLFEELEPMEGDDGDVIYELPAGAGMPSY